MFTLWGSDIYFHDVDGWNNVHSQNTNVAQQFNLPIEFVKTSFKYVLNMQYLYSLIVGKVNDEWWHGLQHGLAIITHSAPVCFVNDIKNVYFDGSTSVKYDDTNKKVCASDPKIDNYIKYLIVMYYIIQWKLLDVIKLDTLVIFLYKKISINLRVCWETRSGFNCCVCEKCVQTIFSILGQGFQPEKFGFDITSKTYSAIATSINTNKFKIHDGNIFNWKYRINLLSRMPNLIKENIAVKTLIEKFSYLIDTTYNFIETDFK